MKILKRDIISPSEEKVYEPEQGDRLVHINFGEAKELAKLGKTIIVSEIEVSDKVRRTLYYAVANKSELIKILK